MAKELSKTAVAIQPSITLEIDASAKALRAQGIDVVGFGAGEPDFNTPEHIIEAARQAMANGKTKYTPAAGTPELRQAICRKLLRDNGLTYTPDQIVVSNGAKHSLFNALQVLCNPGDEVVISAPCWVSYCELIKMAKAVPVLVPADESNGFIAGLEDIENAITAKTKSLILNSPCNPTGAVCTKEYLERLAAIAVKHDVYVISDEIYECLVYDGTKHYSIASFGDEIKALTVVVNGLSKAYAMTGWRIGYTACAANIAKAMSSFQSHATSNPNSIAQAAGIAALDGDKTEQLKMVAEFARRREYMMQCIDGIPGITALNPKGAFYVFANVSGLFGKQCNGTVIDSAMSFARCLLDATKTAVVPGEAFGDKRYIRLSYATSMENIVKGMERIKQFAAGLQQ